MSGYSRHTTSKGQQLLNINPPEASQYNPYQVLPNKPQLIEASAYTVNQNNIASQRLPGQYQTGSVLAQQIKSPYVNSSQNSRQIYQDPSINNRGIQNIYRTTGEQNRNPVLIESRPYFSSQDKVGHKYTNSRTKIGNEQYQHQVQNQNIFGEQQKKKKKQRKQIDQTVCCYPGYWLVILLLGVVIASYSLIILKNKSSTRKLQNESPALRVDEQSTSLTLSDSPSISLENGDTVSDKSTSNTSFMFPPQRHHLLSNRFNKNLHK